MKTQFGPTQVPYQRSCNYAPLCPLHSLNNEFIQGDESVPRPFRNEQTVTDIFTELWERFIVVVIAHAK